MGISPKSLSQIELGNNFVSAQNLEQICSALNVLPSKLFDFGEDKREDEMSYVLEKLKNNPSLLDKISKIITILE